METVVRTQTAFRFNDRLLERLKWKARQEKKSLNAYVEGILERNVGLEPDYPHVTQEWLEKQAVAISGRVVSGHPLPKGYAGLDAFQQAAMDKEVLAAALSDKYGEQG